MKLLLLTEQNKNLAYHLAYWFTALLPVIIGFTVTILLVWFLTKSYKGDRENDGFIGENPKKNKDRK